MTIFVCGGSGAGKSAFAEQLAQQLGGALFYIATMPVVSDEDRKTVERHHRLRAGKGFATLERPGRLEDLPLDSATLLVECISTHVANLMFGTRKRQETARWVAEIKEELAPVLRRTGHTILVSADTAADGMRYSPETEQYRDVLTQVNRHLAQYADAAYEVVCGIPVPIGRSTPC